MRIERGFSTHHSYNGGNKTHMMIPDEPGEDHLARCKAACGVKPRWEHIGWHMAAPAEVHSVEEARCLYIDCERCLRIIEKQLREEQVQL